MNVAVYKPSNTMTAEAVESLRHFASVTRATRAAGVAEAGSGASGDSKPYSGAVAFEANGASFECDFADDGSCRIVKCETSAAELALPPAIEGHAVTAIGPHACATCYSLVHVSAPESIEEIGEYAFMNTALASFDCPPRLRRIGKNAFYKCKGLRRVALNDGLAHVGECAFRESGLESLDVPASVAFIGQDAFRSTNLTCAGDAPTLRISPGNPAYGLLDGALYRATGEGLALVQVLDEGAESYEGPANLAVVDARAFAGLKALRRAVLPEGVMALGENAFKGCKRLAEVVLPDTLRFVDGYAFSDTALAALRIPAALEDVGTAAFYTGGSVARNFRRTIERIEVSPENSRFYLRDGILCQRHAGARGKDAALLYIGDGRRVVIPREVATIGPYAFLNAANVTELHIHDGIESIDVGGFDFGHALGAVVYDAACGEKPAERHVISFPPGQAGRQAVRQVFARGRFDLAFAYAAADNAVLITQDALIRSKAMLERLRDPVMLDERMRAEFERKLARTLPATIVAFGRGGFPQGIDLLFEQGTLNESTIDGAIRVASEADEIAVLSRLMELKRTEFESSLFDFDL